jgi:hypothetical protein
MHRWQYVSVLVRDRAVRGAAACAVIAGLTVVALPSVARAEGGAGPVPMVSDVVPTPIDVAAATDDILEAADPVEVASDPVGVASDALDGALGTEAVDAPAVAPDSTPTDAPTTVDSGEVPVSAPSSADTTPPEPDTTADTASEPPAAPRAKDALAVQVSPTNVNVSIRVESPGDNGPVTQVNVAAATAVGAGFEATAKKAPAAAATGSPQPSSTAGATVSPANQPAISATTTSPDTWTWDWDCLSIPTFSTISPAVSSGGSIPTSWTWNWNCGDNSSRYQPATAVQYHPVNVNVAIRLSSPGNDGPVTQANIAVAVAAGLGAPPGSFTAEPPSTGAAPASPPSAVAASTALSGLEESPAPAAILADTSNESLLPGTSDESLLVGAPLPSIVIDRGLDAPLERSVPFAPTVALVGGSLAPRLPITRAPWSRGSAIAAAFGNGETGARASSPTGSTRSKPSSRWRPGSKPLDYTSASSGASVAPASGGGSSGGGLPIFLALPFILAVLDLARRVALDRVASPSEYRERRPDTPG